MPSSSAPIKSPGDASAESTIYSPCWAAQKAHRLARQSASCTGRRCCRAFLLAPSVSLPYCRGLGNNPYGARFLRLLFCPARGVGRTGCDQRPRVRIVCWTHGERNLPGREPQRQAPGVAVPLSSQSLERPQDRPQAHRSRHSPLDRLGCPGSGRRRIDCAETISLRLSRSKDRARERGQGRAASALT